MKQSVARHVAGLFFFLSLGTPAELPGQTDSGRSADEELVGRDPRIHILLYNYTNVRPSVLQSAKGEAARIYRLSGIELEWVECPRSVKEIVSYPACEKLPDGPAVLQVKILSREMAERYRRPRGVFGFPVLSDQEQFAFVASVFAHRAEQLAKRKVVSRSVVLGHMLAHEIGHLLLGVGGHSPRGIMRADWQKIQLRRASRGQLLFTSSQAEQLRAQAWKRVQASLASGLATDAVGLTVAVYNYAQVPGPTLKPAKNWANRVFRRTWVPFDWLDVPLDREKPEDHFMQQWRGEMELRRAAFGQLLFTPQQAKRIPAEALRRIQTVTVVPYNYAEALPSQLRQAKKETARIFIETGVSIRWLDFPLGDPEAKPSFMERWQQTPEPLRLALRILPRVMAERFGLRSRQFGFALPAPPGEFARTANVFYHRAEELAGLRAGPRDLTFGQKLPQRMSPVAMILGHLMAHEIGHLLLGRDSHSPKGIMSVPWGQVSLRQAAFGELRFTPKEAERIRANLQDRTQAVQSVQKRGRCQCPRNGLTGNQLDRGSRL